MSVIIIPLVALSEYDKVEKNTPSLSESNSILINLDDANKTNTTMTYKLKGKIEFTAGLPDCMHKLAKLLTMLFVFHCICLLFSLLFDSTNDGLA